MGVYSTAERNHQFVRNVRPSPSDLVCRNGEIYRIVSYPGESSLLVEAENLETFERVLLTTADIPGDLTISLGGKRRRRARDGR